MIEKIRIFLSQFIASTLVAFLAMQFGINVVNNTELKNRIANIGLNYESFESIAIAFLIFCLGAICMMLIIWLMRWPKTNYTKKKKKRKTAKPVDMGTIKNVPKTI